MGCPSHSRCDHPPGESENVTLNLGILIAFACAVATQLGFLYKHKGACAAAQVDIRRPVKPVKSLFGSRWFAIGMTAAGLVLLVVTLPAHSGSHSSFSVAGMISFDAGMLAIGALLITGPRIGAPDHHHGVMLGAAAGVLFGVSDVAIKALTGLGGDGILAVVLSPWLLVTIIASVVAFYASARGLQDGEAVPVIASTSTAANVSTILGGIVVFGDPMPGDAVGIALQMFAFVLVVVAALIVPPPLRAAEANARLA